MRAQVAVQSAPDIVKELAVQRIAALGIEKQRLIQAEALAEQRLGIFVHLARIQVAVPGAAGGRVHQNKGDERHEEKRGDHPRKATYQVGGHIHPPTLGRETRPPSGTWLLSADPDSYGGARGEAVTSGLPWPGFDLPPRPGSAAAYFGSMLVSMSISVTPPVLPGKSESCGVVTMPFTHGLTR